MRRAPRRDFPKSTKNFLFDLFERMVFVPRFIHALKARVTRVLKTVKAALTLTNSFRSQYNWRAAMNAQQKIRLENLPLTVMSVIEPPTFTKRSG
jgi:hypothetical protein